MIINVLISDNLILDYNINNCAIKYNKYWRRNDNKIDYICLKKCNNYYPYKLKIFSYSHTFN
jgi:hypothetical protein